MQNFLNGRFYHSREGSALVGVHEGRLLERLSGGALTTCLSNLWKRRYSIVFVISGFLSSALSGLWGAGICFTPSPSNLNAALGRSASLGKPFLPISLVAVFLPLGVYLQKLRIHQK